MSPESPTTVDHQRRRAITLAALGLALGLAGVVGYFFGSILPTLLGAPAVGG